MSRSYKEPYATQQQQGRKSKSSPRPSVYEKRKAARAIRHANKKALQSEKEEVKSGKAYRKNYNSWDIRDWSFEDNRPKGRRK